MPSRFSGTLFVCMLAAYGPLAIGDETDVYFLDVPVVYSSSRLPQSSNDSPNFVTVIDREMIRASGAREIADLMRLVPGFQVTSRNLSTSARVTYHGLSDDDFSPRLQVLIDGRSQYSPLFQGGVNWDLLPVAIEDIERIEVIRGSNVAAYGANAFMGVVNIITQDASQTEGTRVMTSIGSQGVRDQYVRWGEKFGDTAVRVTYQGQSDDGLVRENDYWPNGQKKRLFDIRVDKQLTGRDELRLGLGKLEGRMQIGRSDDVTDPLRTGIISSTYIDLAWRSMLDAGDEFKLRWSSVEDRIEDRFVTDLSSAGGLSVDTLDFGGVSRRHELEAQILSQLSNSVRMAWGAGLQNQQVNSSHFFYDDRANRQIRRVFSHFEWQPQQDLLINLGASIDNDSLSGTHFSPRLSASYHLNEQHTLRAGVSRAYRMPTIYEQVGYRVYGARGVAIDNQTEFRALNSVHPERLLSREVGYVGEFKELGFTFEARAFDEAIPNRIRLVEPPAGGPDYAVNAEDVRVRGIEYQLRWNPYQGSRIIFGQTYADINAQWENSDTASWTHWGADKLARTNLQTLYSMPKTATSLMWMQQLPQQMDFSIVVSHQRDMKWTGSTVVDEFTRIDWRLAKSFMMGHHRGEIAYTVQSQQGRHFELNNEINVDRRRWLSVKFDL